MAERSRPPPRRRPNRSARRPGPRSEGVPLLEVRLPHRPDGHAVTELIRAEGAETRLIACRLTEHTPRRLMRWLDVEVSPERANHLLAALQRKLRSRHVATARLGPGRFLLRLSEPAPPICLATYRAGGICVTCPLSDRAERPGWRIVLPRGGPTQSFLRGLPAAGLGRFAIARLHPHRSDTVLTPRQDHALHVAYQMGYFDYPRRGTLGEVARALGTGRSATLELLRRATTKLAGGRYGDELRGRVVP